MGPTPLKSPQAWAGISGLRKSLVIGYSTAWAVPSDSPTVIGESHQLWSVFLPSSSTGSWAHRCVIVQGGCRLHPPCLGPLLGSCPQIDTL